MCGEACQIPATMAGDLPQPHIVAVCVCACVRASESQRAGEGERQGRAVGCTCATVWPAREKENIEKRS